MTNPKVTSTITLALAAEAVAHVLVKSGVMGTHVSMSVNGEQMHTQALKSAALANFVKYLPNTVKG